MDEYARNDVRYLFELADNLKDQLVAKQRLSWHEEWCRKFVKDACDIEPSDPDKVWRLKGSNALDRRGLAILREIWHWRENEALTAGKPPYFFYLIRMLLRLRAARRKGFLPQSRLSE